MADPINSSSFLGINSSDWGEIGVEALSLLCPVIDVYRGGRDLFDENADKSEAFLKLSFGLMATVPLMGVGLRFLGRSTQFALRSERTAWGFVNKGIGLAMTPLWLGGTVAGVTDTISGIYNWQELNGDERSEVVTAGLRIFLLPAIGLANNHFARRRAEESFIQNPSMDFRERVVQERGLYASPSHALRFRYDGGEDLSELKNGIQVIHLNNTSGFTEGLSSGQIYRGFSGLMSWGYGKGRSLAYIAKERRAVLAPNLSQFATDMLAIVGHKGIKMSGVQHLRGSGIVGELCHDGYPNFAETILALSRVRRGLDPEAVGYRWAITGRKELGSRLTPVVGSSFGGLSTEKAHHTFIPLAGDKKESALNKTTRIIRGLFAREMPNSFKKPFSGTMAVFYTPGTRTREKWVRIEGQKTLNGNMLMTAQGEQFEIAGSRLKTIKQGPWYKRTKTQVQEVLIDDPRILYRPARGAAEVAVRLNKPYYPVLSYRGSDGYVHKKFLAPLDPVDYMPYRLSPLNNMATDADRARAVAAMQEEIIRRMKAEVGQGYFTRYVDHEFRALFNTQHSKGLLG